MRKGYAFVAIIKSHHRCWILIHRSGKLPKDRRYVCWTCVFQFTVTSFVSLSSFALECNWLGLEGFTIQEHYHMWDRKSSELQRQIIRYLNTSVSFLSLFPFSPVYYLSEFHFLHWRNISTESVIRSLYFQFDAWRHNNTTLLLVLVLVQCFSSVIRLDAIGSNSHLPSGRV